MPAHHYRGYCFRVPQAKELASLAGTKIDMQAVADICDRLEALSDVTKLDFTVWEALSSGVVIRYGRCFKKGVRHFLPPHAIDSAPQELRELHTFVMAMRDKHVAHSVNPFEENEVTVQIGDHFTSSAEILSVNTAHGRVLGLALGMPAQLRKLANWWLEWISGEIEAEREKLIALARTIPLERLKRAPQEVLGANTGHHTVATTRKRP